MTIRRQLTLSYLGILLLLACNLLLYLWTDTKREAVFEDLRRAISRQTLISSIQQQIGNYEKQVALLSHDYRGRRTGVRLRAKKSISSTATSTPLCRRSNRSPRLRLLKTRRA